MEADSDHASTMKEWFYSELAQNRSGVAINSVYLTDEHYKKLVTEVSEAQITSQNEPRHYWLLQKYDIMVVQQKQAQTANKGRKQCCYVLCI